MQKAVGEIYMSPEGYLWYMLPPEKFLGLPETVLVDELLLHKKIEFHVSIINTEKVASAISAGDEAVEVLVKDNLLKLLIEYSAEHPLQFGNFIHDLRLATKEDRVSIAARCTMENLEGYFNLVQQTYNKEFPIQPAHVSLYTKTELAVGINSDQEMESFQKIELPEVQSTLNSIRF